MNGYDGLWRERLTAYLRAEANPAHKYGHQPRLYALTQSIVANSPELVIDDDVLFAAAFLHDLGVFVGHRPEGAEALTRWDHVVYVCERAPALLRSFGFPEARIEAVLACIREHQPHDEPHSAEATVLRDADILEQLGTVAVLRTVSKVGSDTRFALFSEAQRSLQRAADTLGPQLRLPAARNLAEPRIAALRAFLRALETEAGQHLDG